MISSLNHALFNLALVHDTKNLRMVIVMVLSRARPSETSKVVNQVENLPGSWFDPLAKYLSTSVLPKDKTKAHSIVYNPSSYFLLESNLYIKMPLGLDLICSTSEANLGILREAYEGEYGSHSGG